MKRVLVVAALALSVLAARVDVASGDERVSRLPDVRPRRGPVGRRCPSRGRKLRQQVQFQLTCPKGFIVGGVDAELSDRAIDVWFLGAPGSPVAPGRTTSRTIVFVATYVGSGARAPTFRPHAGCIPGGGGGSRTPTAFSAIFPPGKPTVRRVRTVRVAAPGRSSQFAAATTSVSSPRTARAASGRRSRRRRSSSRASRRARI